MSAPIKSLRAKLAVALAAVYALCILAPSAAFAFSDNPTIAHCLTEDRVGIHDHGGKTHVHADGTAHQHHGDDTAHRHHDSAPQNHSGDKGQAANFCGLFSVVGVASEPILIPGSSTAASILLPLPPEALSGRGPERINRPPIV